MCDRLDWVWRNVKLEIFTVEELATVSGINDFIVAKTAKLWSEYKPLERIRF